MIVGIVGAGQLARMMALAGIPLGMRFVFLDPAKDSCAAGLGEHLCGAYDDPGLLAQLAERADVVTYEFENVPAASIEFLSTHVPVFPSAIALATSRDRLREKSMFRELGIATPAFAAVGSLEELRHAVAEIGLPAVLKTRTLGYDGKGQAVLREAADIEAAWAKLGGVPLILEGFVRFDREVSMVGVRGRDGELRFYPLSENEHRSGILHLSTSRAGDRVEPLACEYAKRVFEHLDYVGVLALELFQVGDQLLANEMAPRVHNSGHWTIEGAETSQFENHLRAVAGLPLGSTAALGHAAMVNFIGNLPTGPDVLTIPGAHLHLYGKEPRPGRKVAHATIRAQDEAGLRAGIARLETLT